MSDYSSASHQELYDYVQSGSTGDVSGAANLNSDHAKSVSEATTDLQNTLTKIQSSWSGAAADQFSQQANTLVQQMQQHAQNADKTSTWMNYASQSLSWAQTNMPSPPSGAEQALADINNNSITEIGLGILTDGGSYLASKAAQQDIANKKAAATSVMTQLASAYNTANSKLAQDSEGGGTDPVDPSGGGNGNSKGDQNGNGNSSNGSGSGSGASGGVIMPMPIGMPTGGDSGGDYGSRVSTGGYGSGSASGSSSGSGVTGPTLPNSTVTSGLGNLPTSGGTGGTSGISGLGNNPGSGYTSGGVNGTGGFGPGGMPGYGINGTTGGLTEGETTSGGLGGGTGSGKFGAGGLGGGGLGEEGGGAFGSGGFGGGTGKSSALSGGTGTGELGEEAGGTGYGAQAGSGSGSASGAGAAAAAGEAEGTNSSQNNMMGGGMGRSGAGGGGGSQGERGGRASWLKEDPDYWYGDKMKNAAPPGGVIE